MSLLSLDRRFSLLAWLIAAAMNLGPVHAEGPPFLEGGAVNGQKLSADESVIPSWPQAGTPENQGLAGPGPCYWVVSSRGLPQGLGNCESGRLCYFERHSDGQLRRSTRDALAGQMQPGVPICIFIHGSFVTAASHHRESARTYDWIRQPNPQLPLQVIFYTWPSEARFNNLASLNSMAVNQRGYWAESNAFYLADLIAHLPQECPICFVGHSHGARVSVAALHLISGGRIAGRAYAGDTGIHRRYHAVLAAGAFDRHWLNPGQRYDFAVHRADAILNLVNRTDTALHFYHLSRPFARRAIAATGLTRWDRARLGTPGNKVLDCDVTKLIGLGHFWPNYYEQPSLANLIAPYAYFTHSPGNLSSRAVSPAEVTVDRPF